MTSERIASAPTAGRQSLRNSGNDTWNTRSSAANPATLVADDMNAVTGVGAPWYTAAVERGQDVQRDREDLEREEHDDEVVGGGHREHAGGRQQYQREVFGSLETLALDVADGEQEGERGGGDDHPAEEHAEPVDAKHAGDRRDGAVVLELAPLADEERGRRRPAADRQHDRGRED